MAWCKASSLTAAVAVSLKSFSYPARKRELVSFVKGKIVQGWDVPFFLERSLKEERRYGSLREVMSDLESWLEVQG